MNKNRANLAAAMNSAGARSTAQPAVQAAAVERPRTATKKAPSREGMRAVTCYVREEAHKQLRLMCIEKNAKIQEIMVEALNDVFQKYGKPPVA